MPTYQIIALGSAKAPAAAVPNGTAVAAVYLVERPRTSPLFPNDPPRDPPGIFAVVATAPGKAVLFPEGDMDAASQSGRAVLTRFIHWLGARGDDAHISVHMTSHERYVETRDTRVFSTQGLREMSGAARAVVDAAIASSPSPP